MNPVQTTTYVLTPSANPLIFGAGTSIHASVNDGVWSNKNTHWVLTNEGTVQGAHNGFQLQSPSQIFNYGSIAGTAGDGIDISLGAPGSVFNGLTGSIDAGGDAGVFIGGAGLVDNAGSITGANRGVVMASGSLLNESTGYIHASSAPAVELGRGIAVNQGSIVSASGPLNDAGSFSFNNVGVVFDQGGSFTNASGLVVAGVGVLSPDIGPLVVKNGGIIVGFYEGVISFGGLRVENMTGAFLGSDQVGVLGVSEPAGSVNSIDNQADALIGGSRWGVLLIANGPGTTNVIKNAGILFGGSEAGDGGVVMQGGLVNNASGGGIFGNQGVGFYALPGTVNNAGVIVGDVAIGMSAGGKVNNAGVIQGEIQDGFPSALLSGGLRGVSSSSFNASFSSGPSAAIVFNNEGGLWMTNGDSSFGGGTVSNSGRVYVPGSATLNRIGAFNNGAAAASGVISMANGSTGDSLTINGPFNGYAGHSFLELNAFLGGPGSQADVLHLGGGSAGKTLIEVFDTNTGAGAANSSGIVLVTGATKAADFILDPHAGNYDKAHGGVDHGLYFYTLQFHGGNEVLIGQAGSGAHQLATAASAVQNVWSAASFTAPSWSTIVSGIGHFAGGGSAFDRPRVWTAALNTLQSDPTRQGIFTGRAGENQMAALPSLRLSSVQSSAGFDTGYDQGLAMLKGGVDLIRHDDGRRAFAFGVGTAYVQSDQRFTDGGAAMFYSGVVYGAYASLREGAGHLDASFKSAAMKGQYQAPWLAAGNRSGADLTTTGMTLDGGYAFGLARGWSLEPVASLAALKTSTADLLIGQDMARFKAGYSGWANFGAKLSGEGKAGGYGISGSLTARVWDRFGDDNTAYLAGLGDDSPLVDRITGVSGEVAAELRVASGPHAYGFLQSSARTGAGRQAASLLAGVALHW